MDQIWLAAPSPAMRLWPGRPQAEWRLNPAAIAWGRAAAVNDAAWTSTAMELAAAHTSGGARDGALTTLEARWRSLPMSTGWLVWLMPERRPQDRTEFTDPADLARTGHHPAGFARHIDRLLPDVLRAARIAVWRLDIEQRTIQLNDVGCDMLGIERTAEPVALDAVRTRAHPDDAAMLADCAARALSSDAIIDAEIRYAGLDGPGYKRLLTRRVAERDATGRVTGLLGLSLEQTERIVERERAQALAQRIEMVADTAGVGVYSVDLSNGEIEWNRQMFLIHGLSPDREPPRFDQLVSECLHPEDRAGFAHARLVLNDAEAGFEGEVRIRHPNGSIRWVEYRSRRDRVGEKWFVLGIAIDVTERVRQRVVTERSLREKEAAERANAAKSDFLARMSHELRTPLNAVLGFAQLIEQGGAGVSLEVQRERVSHIRQAGEKLLALIGDVLDRVHQEGLTDPGALASAGAWTGDDLSGTTGRSRPNEGNPALTVLYIEDNPVNVILVEQLVAMRPSTHLHCAADGLSGVAWAAARHPDVVLVDMQLPDIDGFEVLRRLRRVRGLDRSAIIALSANCIADDIALAMTAGFDDYWTKPIDFKRFLSGLDRLAAVRTRQALATVS